MKSGKKIGGILIVLVVLGASFFYFQKALAYGECSDYGFMATYDYLSGGCKCMSGYVFGKDFMGQTTCVSGNSMCTDKYGYHARYDSLSNSCECSYSYVFGKDSIGRIQCVSPDSICNDQLGYNSSYNSLYDRCECSYGYVISGGQCINGDSVCRSDHGSYSSYNTLDKTCECNDGYTLNDLSQCVEKQNNVYFYLKELDEDRGEAIIQSTYDYKYYLISYGIGCLSIDSYLNKNIVVNLGTDYYLDPWDKIVLPDHDQTCNIVTKDWADSDTTLEEEPVITPVYISPNFYSVNNDQDYSKSNSSNVSVPLLKKTETPKTDHYTASSTDFYGTQKKESWLKKLWRFIWGF